MLDTKRFDMEQFINCVSGAISEKQKTIQLLNEEISALSKTDIEELEANIVVITKYIKKHEFKYLWFMFLLTKEDKNDKAAANV